MSTAVHSKRFSSGLYELVIGMVLLAPIIFYLFGLIVGEGFGLFASICLPLGLIVTLRRSLLGKQSLASVITRAEIESFAFLLVLFAFSLWACLQWPDFIAMGERLRDYALLAAVIDSPIVPREPWMVGESLNYYLYWYRFCAYWSSVFGISVWNAYHLLAAFCFALFAGSLFRLSRVYLRIPLLASLFIAIIIPFGSNLAGVFNAFSGSADWWGPSRVIKGAINEFPAWSFLLGDLHPHFLNLAITPILLCFAGAFLQLSLSWAFRLTLVVSIFTVGGAFHYNTNAWEVPMAGISFGIILILALYGYRRSLSLNLKSFFDLIKIDLRNPAGIALIATLVLSLWSLIISSLHLSPADYPWRWVKPPIPQSKLFELLLHWIFPFLAILVGLIARLNFNSLRTLGLLGLFSLSVASQQSSLIIGSLSLWLIYEAMQEFKTATNQSEETPKIALLYGLGLSSLVLIALGELIFLDDPYGGENERMNTLFKIYSAVWGPLHLFAFCFAYRALIALDAKKFIAVGSLCLAASLPAFFFHTIKHRRNWNPSMEGLASIEQQFPGSADAIRFLRSQPRKTLLEAQGNPYSYTTHVATLGGQSSYLGWANHVGLLTGNHTEVSRREKVSDQVFKEQDCEAKRRVCEEEKIDLLVFGALEKQKYGDASKAWLSCFTPLFSNQEYTIYSVVKP